MKTKFSNLVVQMAENGGGQQTYYDDQIEWDLRPSEVIAQEGWGRFVEVNLKGEGCSTKIEVVVHEAKS